MTRFWRRRELLRAAGPRVTVGETADERARLIDQLEQTSQGAQQEPKPSRDDFAALQAQTLGSGALGADRYAR